MELQVLRNATLKLNFAGLTFLIDPFFAQKFSIPPFAGRSKNPTSDLPLPIEEILNGVDYVLVSHLHPDHFDAAAQNTIPRGMPIICQPSDANAIWEMGFHNVIPVGEHIIIEGVRIYRTEGSHGQGKVLQFMGAVSGFVFKHNSEETLYWCGDTIWCTLVENAIVSHDPKFIVCHAGGNKFSKDFNVFGPDFQEETESLIMDEKQVVNLCKTASNSRVIATHLEALDHETVTRMGLRSYTLKNGISPEQLMIPENGEILTFENETI